MQHEQCSSPRCSRDPQAKRSPRGNKVRWCFFPNLVGSTRAGASGRGWKFRNGRQGNPTSEDELPSLRLRSGGKA